MKELNPQLSEFLSEVVMTGYYLSEPQKSVTNLLHDSEMKCLKIIDKFGPLPILELAKLMHASKSRTTQIVNSLEAKLLINKATASDHRVKLVTTTKQGRDYVQKIKSKYDDLANQIIEQLGDQDSRLLVDLLSKITPLSNNLKKEKI